VLDKNNFIPIDLLGSGLPKGPLLGLKRPVEIPPDFNMKDKN